MPAREHMSTRKKLFSGIFALALLAAGVFFIFQANRGPRAETQKSAPVVPVTAVPVVQKSDAGAPARDRQRRAVHHGRASRRGSTASSSASSSRKATRCARVRYCSRSTRARSPPTSSRRKPICSRTRRCTIARSEQEKRYKDLLAKNFISPDAYEQVRTNLATAAAVVAADEAAIENAKLSLDYATIRAPVTGYAGRIQIQQGNLVKANDTNPLVTINQVVPIYASFSVPEQNIADIRKYLAAGELKVQATFPNAAHAPVDRQAVVHRQFRRHDDRHDQAQGRVPEHRQGAVAGPVRQRRADAARAEGRDRDARRPRCRAVPTASTCSSSSRTMTVELRNIKIARAEGDDTVVASGLAGRRSSRHGGPVAARARHQSESSAKGAPGVMNIAELFVRRPVMTVLVMTGISDLRHHRLSPAAGERAAQRRLSHDPGSGAAARARARTRWRPRSPRRSKSNSRRSPASTR